MQLTKIFVNIFTLLCVVINAESQSAVSTAASEHASHSYVKTDFSASGDIISVSDPAFGLGLKYIFRGVAVPNNVHIDEIYLKLEYRNGTTPDINDLYEIIGCNQFFGSVKNSFHSERVGRFLILSNNYIKGEYVNQNIGIMEPGCWTFTVTGKQHRTESDIIGAEINVTYHSAKVSDSGGVPVLEGYNQRDGYTSGVSNFFTGRNTLSQISPSVLDSEVICSPVQGRKVPDSTDNLIVLIHGWNPSGRLNSYAPHKRYADPCERGDEFPENVEFSWYHLYKNLIENQTINEDWVVSRYDWAQDAFTGEIEVLNGQSHSRADESRDRSHVHGLRLAKIIETLEPKRVKFIAHSAGNWAARRASDYLKHHVAGVEIEHIALDPFVNNKDSLTLGDLDLKSNFSISHLWLDSNHNYYVYDIATDSVGYTSNNFNQWNNSKLDDGSHEDYASFYMNDHSGPIYWYANSVDNKAEFIEELGFKISLPYRYSSQNCYSDLSNFNDSRKEAICVLRNLGVLTNERDQFYGDEFITREEALKLVSKVSEIQFGIYNRPANALSYSDVVDLPTDFWRKYFVEMLDKGVINGEIKNGIKYVTPKRNVSYGEIIKMVVNVFKGEGILKNGFKEDEDPWGCRYHSCVNQEGTGWGADRVDVFSRLTPVSACGTTDFDRPVKRHEVAYFIYNALDIWGNLNSQFNPNIGLCLIPNFNYQGQ